MWKAEVERCFQSEQKERNHKAQSGSSPVGSVWRRTEWALDVRNVGGFILQAVESPSLWSVVCFRKLAQLSDNIQNNLELDTSWAQEDLLKGYFRSSGEIRGRQWWVISDEELTNLGGQLNKGKESEAKDDPDALRSKKRQRVMLFTGKIIPRRVGNLGELLDCLSQHLSDTNRIIELCGMGM